MTAKVGQLYLPAIECGQLKIRRWNIMNIADQGDGPVLPTAVKITASGQHTHDDYRQHHEDNSVAFQQTFP